MQLKLLPPHPLPTVLFTLAYPAPPSNLPLPASYATLLKLIVEENLLDSDSNVLERVDGASAGAGAGRGSGQGSLTPHALDRATWIAAVLSEVVFDLSGDADAPASDNDDNHPDCHNVAANDDAKQNTLRVVCRYVDGREVAWTLSVPASPSPDAETTDEKEARACYDALQAVLRDVNESAAAGERERRDRERRHAYHDMHPFSAPPNHRGGSTGGFERYDRYPSSAPRGAVHGQNQPAKRPSSGMVRSYSFEEPRAAVETEERRRRSLDEGEMGREAEVHVPGVVETRRGKGRKGVPKEREKEREDAKKEEGKDGKGKHKKQRSLLMSIVALA